MTKLEQVEKILKDNGLRVTESRKAVAYVLIRNQSSFLSSEEIFNKIQEKTKYTCDQVSVYRTLSKLEELDLVTMNRFAGEAASYKLNLTDTVGHEHYFRCKKCRKIEPIKGCFVSKIENDLSKKGYRDFQHHLEITGLCPKCA